jgi:hypothetical protein
MEHDTIEVRGIVERYVAGTLPAADQEAFEAHLIDCAACVEKVEWAERIRSGLAAQPAAAAPVERLPKASSTSHRWVAPAAIALAAALAIAFFGAKVVQRRLREMTEQLFESRNATAALQRSLDDASIALAAERQARADLTAKLQKLTAAEAAPVYALAVTRGSGSGEPDTVLRLPLEPSWIVISVEVGGFRTYAAQLKGDDGRVVWASEGLHAGAHGGLALGLRSNVLPEGAYHLQVDGVETGRRTLAAVFRFQVARP